MYLLYIHPTRSSYPPYLLILSPFLPHFIFEPSPFSYFTSGLTPLHKAVDSYVDNQFQGSAISLLLSHTSDNINTPDMDGNTPIARACWRYETLFITTPH